MIFPRRKSDPAVANPGPNLPQEWAPGHFYSSIPSADDVVSGLSRISDSYGGIDLNEATQAAFLEDIRQIYPKLRFPEERTPGRRYYFNNGSFGALDAICLAAMTARFKPKRMIEVGSGHSSAAILDLWDDGFFQPAELIFIDPDFSRLNELISDHDRRRITLLQQRVQDAALSIFSDLQAGDILFIDSSHVSKIGSDVNFLLFEVLPTLKPGVVVHIHDVFAGFEYPKQWLDAGRYWNEQYLLRAFLMYNSRFEILFMSSPAFNRHNDFFKDHAPQSLKSGGGQLWIRRKPEPQSGH